MVSELTWGPMDDIGIRERANLFPHNLDELLLERIARLTRVLQGDKGIDACTVHSPQQYANAGSRGFSEDSQGFIRPQGSRLQH